MKKVYTIGEVLVDMMMDKFPNYQAMFGGAPANVAMNVAKFGAPTYFLGNFGEDHLASFLRKTMKKRHINLDYATSQGKTTLAFVSGDDFGERDFQFYSESDLAYDLPENLELDDNSIVHFGGQPLF